MTSIEEASLAEVGSLIGEDEDDEVGFRAKPPCPEKGINTIAKEQQIEDEKPN